MSNIDEVKARIDIIDLVSETVKLRRSGKNYTGFCPFHPNSHTPAFVVFPDSGTWRCFGQCNEGGDIFKFVMKKDGLDFPQALAALAARAGIVLQPMTPEKKEEADSYDRLREMMEEAVTFYRHQLFHTAAGQTALDYLHRRQIKDATIEVFGLGYAPHAWDELLKHFTAKGYSQADMAQAGMITERDNGGFYDRFRNRITFPIRDPMGRMAGFGARILDPNDIPKFLNSPQTVLFDKGRLLYALDAARKAIRAQDQVVIVEGYLDAIALHQGGFTNTVSPMGTALTEDQLRLLKRLTRRIVLALDADAAGEKATLRGLELARQAMDHSPDLGFDARGLLRSEARLQADLRVTTLPPGMDPDEVVNRDPAEWTHILEQAKPIVVHVMETLAAGRDLDDPKVKSAIAAQVTPLIEDVPDSVERDAYRQRLARLLKVDEDALLGSRAAQPRQRRTRVDSRQSQAQTRPQPPIGQPVRASTVLERFCLNQLLCRPDSLYLLDRALQQSGLSRLSIQDFENTDFQVILRTVQQSLEQDAQDPSAYVTEHLPETLQELAQELRGQGQAAHIPYEKQMEEVIRAVMRLRLNHITESIDQLRFLQKELQEQGDPRATPYQELVIQHTQTRIRLDRALRQPSGH